MPRSAVDSPELRAYTPRFDDRRPSAVEYRLWRGGRPCKDGIVAKKVAKKSVKAAGKRAGAAKAKKAKTRPAKTLAKPKAAPARKKAAKSKTRHSSKSEGGKTATRTAKRTMTKAAPKRLTKSPLTKPQLRQFREMLLAKRHDLIGDMNGIQEEVLGNNGTALSNMPTHPADIGTDNFEQEFTLGLLESERTLLKEIEDALVRMEAGTYGICVGTGEAIGLARLKARPWAKYSIEYTRLMEQGLVSPLDEEELADDEDAGSPDLDDDEDA